MDNQTLTDETRYEQIYSGDYMQIYYSVPQEISQPILAYANSEENSKKSEQWKTAVAQTLFYLSDSNNVSVALADKFNGVRFEIRELNGRDLKVFPSNLIDRIVKVLQDSFYLYPDEALEVLDVVNNYFISKEQTPTESDDAEG